MYRPAAFTVDDVDEAHRLIRAASVAHLVTVGEAGLDASVVPLLLDAERGPYGTLVGHLARPNPQWKDLGGGKALAIFAGPDAYVSPSTYPTKATNPKVVPTWNYEVVHAHGRLVVHDDPAWVEGLVRRLTQHHEGGRAERWAVDDAPEAYIEAMTKAIVGIELEITRLEAKRKLSQNRSEDDRAGVRSALAAGTAKERAVADAMR